MDHQFRALYLGLDKQRKKPFYPNDIITAVSGSILLYWTDHAFHTSLQCPFINAYIYGSVLSVLLQAKVVYFLWPIKQGHPTAVGKALSLWQWAIGFGRSHPSRLIAAGQMTHAAPWTRPEELNRTAPSLDHEQLNSLEIPHASDMEDGLPLSPSTRVNSACPHGDHAIPVGRIQSFFPMPSVDKSPIEKPLVAQYFAKRSRMRAEAVARSAA